MDSTTKQVSIRCSGEVKFLSTNTEFLNSIKKGN